MNFRFNPCAYGTMLFDVQDNLQQQSPLMDAELEDRLLRYLVDLMSANDVAYEQFQRLGIAQRVAGETVHE